jgi:hypothetical protein
MMKKPDTRFEPGVSVHEATKWKPGQSGNPAGISKLRANFERTFTEPLVSGAEEAAQLLWKGRSKGRSVGDSESLSEIRARGAQSAHRARGTQ